MVCSVGFVLGSRWLGVVKKIPSFAGMTGGGRGGLLRGDGFGCLVAVGED